MEIVLMQEDHLSTVAAIDHAAFGRDRTRSVENLRAQRASVPEACFVALSGETVAGFIFARVLGNEAYFGPLGVLPEFQGRGIGQSLVRKCVPHLMTRCPTVGLEVKPEIGRNVGLYHRLGFVSAFPTILFELPSGPLSTKSSASVLRLQELDEAGRKAAVEAIDAWTADEFEGARYAEDLRLALSLGGAVAVMMSGLVPIGFFVHAPQFLPYCWGVVSSGDKEAEVMHVLLVEMQKAAKGAPVTVAVNARYRRATRLLVASGCKVSRTMNRMLLEGYTGGYFSESSRLAFRGWYG